MDTRPWYQRYAWLWFAAMSAVGLVGGAVLFARPESAGALFARFGYPLPAVIEADPAAAAYFEFVAHWTSTATLGFNLFGLLIAATAFRRGERWAWYACWFWPAFFTAHFATYQSGFRYAQVAWVVISVAVLLATRPERRERAGAPGVASAARGSA